MSAKRKGKRRGKAPSKRAMRRRAALPPPRWVAFGLIRAFAVARAVTAWSERIAQHFVDVHRLPRGVAPPSIVYGSIT